MFLCAFWPVFGFFLTGNPALPSTLFLYPFTITINSNLWCCLPRQSLSLSSRFARVKAPFLPSDPPPHLQTPLLPLQISRAAGVGFNTHTHTHFLPFHYTEGELLVSILQTASPYFLSSPRLRAVESKDIRKHRFFLGGRRKEVLYSRPQIYNTLITKFVFFSLLWFTTPRQLWKRTCFSCWPALNLLICIVRSSTVWSHLGYVRGSREREMVFLAPHMTHTHTHTRRDF